LSRRQPPSSACFRLEALTDVTRAGRPAGRQTDRMAKRETPKRQVGRPADRQPPRHTYADACIHSCLANQAGEWQQGGDREGNKTRDRDRDRKTDAKGGKRPVAIQRRQPDCCSRNGRHWRQGLCGCREKHLPPVLCGKEQSTDGTAEKSGGSWVRSLNKINSDHQLHPLLTNPHHCPPTPVDTRSVGGWS
jgi:hypothetical protein